MESQRSGFERRPPGLLSLVVPVYNEQENLAELGHRLSATLNSLSGWEAEVIFVDDGSRDGSFAILRQLQHSDTRFRILRLSRNFGSSNAVLAGVHAASGNAVMWISSDLQDPPELVPELLRRWEEGADVVWAVRGDRHDPWPRRVAARCFYWLIRRLAVPQYPPEGMDVCLMDRRVAEAFGRLTERNRFTQGLVMNLGFRQEMVPYTRERRRAGRSKMGSFLRLAQVGIDMIVGFSASPLRVALSLGLLTGLGAVLLGVALLARSLSGMPVAGWSVAVWAVLAVGALNLIFVGVLGEYVWRILDEVRGRPPYVIEEKVGFDQRPGAFARDLAGGGVTPTRRD